MPVSYTVIMIRSAGAKFPPEYSDSNLMVKTQCVKQMWLSGNCRAPLVVSVSSTANPVITATQHSSGCMSVCPAAFIPVTVIVPDPHSPTLSSLSHIST